MPTALAPEILKEKLKRWKPRSIQVDFNSGVSTKDLKRRNRFVEHPLGKFSVVETAIPLADISGGRLLDVGCNAGYNSIHVAAKYGFG